MPEYLAITIRIPRETWETIERHTLELQGRAGSEIILLWELGPRHA